MTWFTLLDDTFRYAEHIKRYFETFNLNNITFTGFYID